MSSFWRPFDEDDEQPVTQGRHSSVTTLKHLPELSFWFYFILFFCAEISIEPKSKKTKKRRYQVTGVEQKIVLKAYSENSGWDEILTAIKERLSQPMGGNFMKNESIREYYRSTPRESSIKRIRRIVSQNLQKAKQLTATTSTSETAMSQTIVDNRMRYAKKCSPEERKSAKFSQAACLDEDSSGTDADADLPGEANPTSPEPKQDKPKKKRSRKRQRKSEEAHKAHTEMCGKAVKMMSKIERLLD